MYRYAFPQGCVFGLLLVVYTTRLCEKTNIAETVSESADRTKYFMYVILYNIRTRIG